MSNANYTFKNVNDALIALAGDVMAGDLFESRAGSTREITNISITLTNPWQREIVIPHRKANLAAQIVETMWVLTGRNDVATLTPYLPRAADFSDDGVEWRSGYGPRLRNFRGVDQLAYVVDTLRTNPSSRQAVITIWDPQVDTVPGKDVACNNWLSFSARHNLLDLTVGIRSNDLMWGWSGINAFEWSTLLELVASMTNLRIGQLHFSTTSLHLYEIHWERAGKISELQGNFLYTDSPPFNVSSLDTFDVLAERWFALEEAIRMGRNPAQSVLDFPDPMLRSWLQVLQWYWSGDEAFLPRHGRLAQACKVGVRPAGTAQLDVADPRNKPELFLRFVNALHEQKHAAYGDSWKRRGEYMIMANIARKIDRLSIGGSTDDETQVDTAIDLMVYLAKYLVWLGGGEGNPFEVKPILDRTSRGSVVGFPDAGAVRIVERFADLERETEIDRKVHLVNTLLRLAHRLALDLWEP